jgi:Domain of unknown function (DUF4124)
MKKLALLFAFTALFAQAQVYKWVDDKGQVHYGEQPPPEAKTTTVHVPPPGDAPAPTPAAKPKAAPGEPAKQAFDMPKDKSERCKLEQEQLAILNTDRPIVFTNDKKEPETLSDEKRTAEKKLVQENVKKYCS